MNVLVGFDGFVDEIFDAVDVRTSQDHYVPIKQISQFSQRVNKTCNIEWVSHGTQLGGNAPLLARALIAQDIDVTFIGACGKDHVFSELKKKAKKFYSIAEPGLTSALEFEDGKIFLGKTTPLNEITPERIKEKIGKEPFFELFHQIDAFACVNWTMIPNMNRLWDWILLNMPPLPKRPLCLIDLADPKKRTDEDLKSALHLIQRLQTIFDVVLSFNQSEGDQIARILGSTKLEISYMLLHTKSRCSVTTRQKTIEVPVPPVQNPIRLTGAGDHFNAGFIIGLLQTHDAEKALHHAVATAQFLIQNGRSPKRDECIKIC